MLTALKHLPRNVWIVGLVSLLNDSASEMIYPLVPLYLTSVLMAGPKALGLIEGIAEATASLLKLFSGMMVDRTRATRPWIVAGYALAGFGRPLIAFARSWPGLLCIRFADRVGKGLRSSPRDALLAASVVPEQRGLAFGLHRAMDNAGAVIGPVAAAVLLYAGLPLEKVFLLTVIPAVLCLGLTLAIKDDAVPVRVPKMPAFQWRLTLFPPAFKGYLVVVALFTLSNSSNMFLLLRARELGVGEAFVPLLWAGVSCVAMLASIPLSALSDRIGRLPLLITGYGVYALFYAGLGLIGAGSPWLLAGLFAGYGLFMGATEGVEKALVADMVPQEARGTAYGWFNLVSGLCLLPSSLVFGLLYQDIAPLAAFGFSALLALAAAGLLLRLGNTLPPKGA